LDIFKEDTMFERTISHLQREIRARNTIANDTTGVVAQGSKDQAISDAKEFQEAIAVLEQKGWSWS
jgi:tetrahydromethanopterin S-methyltransferase subunit B